MPCSLTCTLADAGDPALGKKYFYSQNCYACHLGPDDRPGSGLPQATLDRFASRDELPPLQPLPAQRGWDFVS